MKFITTTKRLFLREFILEDAANFYHLNKDPEVIRYTGDSPFLSIQEAEDFIKNYSTYRDYGYGRWAVCEKENQQFLGFCGLKYHPVEKITEVGFRFYQKYWNQGFATESALACIHFGFSNLHLPTIYAHAHIDNVASQRVLEKCGLQFVKEFTYDNQPTYFYGIQNPQQ